MVKVKIQLDTKRKNAFNSDLKLPVKNATPSFKLPSFDTQQPLTQREYDFNTIVDTNNRAQSSLQVNASLTVDKSIKPGRNYSFQTTKQTNNLINTIS